MQADNGLIPPYYAYCGNFDGGLLLFNSCVELERMAVINAKSIDKSEVMQKVMQGFGGQSFVYIQGGKRQNAIKKLFKTMVKGENRQKLL